MDYSTEDMEATGGRITASLGLLEHVRRPSIRFDVVPVLDLLALALLMSLLFTRFVMLPGVRVELPSTELRMQHSSGPVDVLTIENDRMLFFEGSVHTVDSIGRALRARASGREGREAPVLLVKARATMELEAFLEVCGMAQEAGYAQVQVSGDKASEAEEWIPGARQREAEGALRPVL